MSFDINTLITDRTETDYLHWLELRNKGYFAMTDEQKAEWNARNMKGAYNARDLNRVGNALNYLRDRLVEAGYLSPYEFTAKTNWTVSGVPTADDLTAYLNFVSIVREAMAHFPNTPSTPTDSGGLDITEANNIEKILIDVDTLINNMLAARFFVKDLFAGEI